VFIEAKDDGSGGDNWSYIGRAKLQSNHHHQQTSTLGAIGKLRYNFVFFSAFFWGEVTAFFSKHYRSISADIDLPNALAIVNATRSVHRLRYVKTSDGEEANSNE